MAERLGAYPTAVEARPEHLPWNFGVITLDAGFYIFALAFADANTVLPALISRLTPSPIAIGAIAAIRGAGWFLPQLLVASRLAHRERKKGFMVLVCLLGRVPILTVVAALLIAPSNAALGLGALFFAITVFALSEGASGVPWTDIVAKAIPDRLRGRFFASMQIFGGLAAAGAGLVVKRVLESPTIAYPRNYALLFSLTWLFLMVSLAFLAMIREPIRPVREQEIRVGELVRQAPAMLRRRPGLVRLVIVEFALAAALMAAPFYVVYATRHLSVPESMVGAFVSVQMLAGMAGGLLLGYLSDRRGSATAIRVTAVGAIICPLVALVVPMLSPGGLAGAWVWCYSGVFAFLALVLSGTWIGPMNFLLESVSHEERAGYVGLLNTLVTPQCVFPLVGSCIAAAGSYTALFAASLACGVVSLALALTLKDPRAHTELTDDVCEGDNMARGRAEDER